MPKLILKFKDRVINEIPLTGKKVLTIGRKNINDVVIDNLAVSGVHAKIFRHEKGFVLADLKSKNGTFVNEKRIKTYLLKHKDQITIGKHSLLFDVEGEVGAGDAAGAAHAAAGGLTADQTMIIDTEQYRKMLGKKKDGPAGKSLSASVRFLSGGEGEVSLAKSVTTIGKDADADILIGGLFSFLAGSTAAAISKTAQQYSIRHVSGFIKPKVNGQIVRSSVTLNEKDIIRIGSLMLEFRMPPSAGE